MIGWVTVGFLSTLGMLELSFQMGKITGKKGERYILESELSISVWLKTVK